MPARIVVTDNVTRVVVANAGAPGPAGPSGAGVIVPETYGAVGDGVTDDTDAFLDMIATEGLQARMQPGSPDAVYLISGELIPLAWQTFTGFRFKRADQAVTTLTAAMTDTVSASVVLQVVSSAAFRVGSYVTLTKVSPSGSDIANETHTDKSVHKILSKTATTITVSTAFGLTFAIGDEVISAYHIVRNTAGQVTFRDCEFDGNRANWQNKGIRWENMTEVRSSGPNCTFDNIIMNDIPGEGIQLGGDGSVATNLRGDNFGGNPIHMSGGDDLTVSAFTFTNCNQVWFETDEATRGYDAITGQPNTPGTVGHEDGGIAWSLDCNGAKVGPGTIDTALSGFSPPTSVTADEATIIGVTVRNTKTPFKMFIDTGFARGNSISLCKFYNCGTGFIGRTTSGLNETNTQVRTSLIGNEFLNTSLIIRNTFDVEITGGWMKHDVGLAPAGRGVIDVSNCIRVRINTTIDGAVYGVYASGNVEYLDLSGSRFLRWTIRAVDFGDIAPGAVGNRMIGGEIEAAVGFAPNGSYGVIANGGDEFSNIHVDFLGLSSGFCFYTAADNTIFRNNTLRVGSGVVGIRADGGTSGVVATGNKSNTYPGTWELANIFSNGGGAANTFINDADIYRASGTDVAVADGGTGASTAADARTNLNVYSKPEVDGLVGGTGIPASLAQYMAASLEPDAIEALQKGTFSYGVAANATKLLVESWSTRLGSAGRMEQRNPGRHPLLPHLPLRNTTLVGLQSGSSATLIDPTIPTYADAAATYYERLEALLEMPTRNIAITAASQSVPLLPGAYGAMVIGYTCFDFAWLNRVVRDTYGPNFGNEISDSAAQRIGDTMCLPINKAVAGDVTSSSFSTGTPLGSVTFVLLPSTWSAVPDPVASSYVWRDDFMDDTTLDTGVWTRAQSVAGNVEIETLYQWCKVKGSNVWGQNSARRTAMSSRSEGRTLVADVYAPNNATSSQGVMVAWNNGAGLAVANNSHMVTLGDGYVINIDENGTRRQQFTAAWTKRCLYRIKIRLLAGGGAQYFIQGGKEYPDIGSATWTSITPGTSSSADNSLCPSFGAWGAHDYRVSDFREFVE